MWQFVIPALDQPTTISTFLSWQQFSLTLRRRIKREGSVVKNGQPASLGDFLAAQDSIVITLPASPLRPLAGALDIVYEDADLLVVNKPAGLITHPLSTGEEPSLVNFALHHCQQQQSFASVHPVTRLDRNTSGLLLLTKNPRDHSYLQCNPLQKSYLALLDGIPPAARGDIFLPIARKPGSIIERTVSAAGQPAHSSYQIMQRYANRALVRFELHTGRTHQIRVHAAACGFPLVGDDLYGFAKAPPLPGQALHAWQLIFYHPHTHERLHLRAPLPSSWHGLLRQG